MPVSIQAEVRIAQDRTAAVIARVKGLTDERMAEFAADVEKKAKENAAAIPFAESTGELAREIYSERIGDRHYRVETRSGHASFIEFGTRFIQGKNPFLWPAYRWVKKRFFKGTKWV